MFLERNAIYVGNDGNLYRFKRQNFAKAVYLFEVYCPVFVCGIKRYTFDGEVYLFESDIDDLFKEVDFGD